jgi:hypothetical protein
MRSLIFNLSFRAEMLLKRIYNDYLTQKLLNN